MKKNLYEISLTEYHYHANGRVTVYFKNQITGMSRMKEYKNASLLTLYHCQRANLPGKGKARANALIL